MAKKKATKAEKVKYVKSQGQTRPHHCHGQMPGCKGQCPPAMWGCYPCWMKLPKRLRDKIWAVYRPGQEKDMSPSREYIKVATEVQEWIKENYAGQITLLKKSGVQKKLKPKK